jgi:hypothetical protein
VRSRTANFFWLKVWRDTLRRVPNLRRARAVDIASDYPEHRCDCLRIPRLKAAEPCRTAKPSLSGAYSQRLRRGLRRRRAAFARSARLCLRRFKKTVSARSERKLPRYPSAIAAVSASAENPKPNGSDKPPLQVRRSGPFGYSFYLKCFISSLLSQAVNGPQIDSVAGLFS